MGTYIVYVYFTCSLLVNLILFMFSTETARLSLVGFYIKMFVYIFIEIYFINPFHVFINVLRICTLRIKIKMRELMKVFY